MSHSDKEKEPPGQIHFESVIDRYPGHRGHFVDVPEEVSLFFSNEKNVRLLCAINGGEAFHCALRPKGNGTFDIAVGTPIRNAGKLRLGQRVSVSLERDTSSYGRPMPEELAELLEQDEVGNQCFQQANASVQRGILYYINSGKTVQTRIDRAIRMIDRLKHEGKKN